ncbi:MAG: deoxyribodipyrimidine photo-lyase, partial [Haloarculaceae archaeon]
MPTSHPDDDGSVADATDTDHRGVVVPSPSTIPTPAAVVGDEAATGYVVWHRKHLRTDDHLALSEAIADGDVVCPLFVFDPTFYDDGGLACDTRIRFLHEAATSLDRLYAATSGGGVQPAERESVA